MPKINYQIQTNPEKTSRAGFSNARLSWKDSVEIARFIKGMKTAKAKAFLQDVLKKKRALPLKRFHKDRAHKSGKTGPGRYPVNTSKRFIELIESAEKNAESKGLDTKNLIIQYAFANKGAGFSRPRRNEFRGQVRKSANVSIILKETGIGIIKKKKEKTEKKPAEKKEEKTKEKTDALKIAKAKKETESKKEKEDVKSKISDDSKVQKAEKTAKKEKGESAKTKNEA